MKKVEKILTLLKLEFDKEDYGIIARRISDFEFIFISTKKDINIRINISQKKGKSILLDYYFDSNYYLKSELIDIDKIEWIILYDLVISN